MARGSFSLDISRFAERTGAKVDLVVRKVGIDMLTRIVLRSPVDTGRFRANWVVSIGSRVYLGEDPSVDPSGRVTIEKGIRVLTGYKAGTSLVISNYLPYALRLEDGYSRQAPAGMVAISVAEFTGLVNQAAKDVRR